MPSLTYKSIYFIVLLPNSIPIPQDPQTTTLTHTIITATQAPLKDLEDMRKANNRKSPLIKPNQLNPLLSNRPPPTQLVELKISLAAVLIDLNKAAAAVVEAPACSVENITKEIINVDSVLNYCMLCRVR